MALWQWSKTSTSNSNSDSTMNWSEGIPPSIVDDNVRALMARVAEWRDDTSGNITTGGTPPNYTLSTNQGIQTPTPTVGQLIAFQPSVTNVGGDVISMDGGSNYQIQTSPGFNVGPGVLVAFSPYTMMFNGTAWVLRDFYASPFVIPIGGIIDWTLLGAPGSNFALPAGQAISRTTYSGLFGLYNSLGLPYGSGDGSTTFNIPDLRGRVSAGLDTMPGTGQGNAGRIGTTSTDTGTIVGTTIGSNGGSATHVQTGSELAIHSHSGSGNVSDPTHTHTTNAITTVGGSNLQVGGGSNNPTASIGSATTGISVPSLNINNAGSSSAMALLQPTIMLNKILRIL